MKFNLGQIIFGSTVMLFVLVPLASALAQETSGERAKQIEKKITITKNQDQEQTIEAKVVDGKVIIIDGSGHERVIELGEGKGAANIIIEQKVESDGGEQKRWGRAVIVGPDGEKKVVELDKLPEGSGDFSWRYGPGGRMLFSGDGQGVFSFDDLEGMQALGLGGSKFRIGVSCEPVGGALKVHLGVEHGLVVQDVVDESPAANAGIKQYDILMQANGQDLRDIDQLVEVVQDAGEEEESINITATRLGEQLTFEVKPEKRKAASFEFELPAGMDDEAIRERLGGMLGGEGREGLRGFRFERPLPGIIQGDLARPSEANMQRQIEELKQQIEELKDMIREIKDR